MTPVKHLNEMENVLVFPKVPARRVPADAVQAYHQASVKAGSELFVAGMVAGGVLLFACLRAWDVFLRPERY